MTSPGPVRGGDEREATAEAVAAVLAAVYGALETACLRAVADMSKAVITGRLTPAVAARKLARVLHTELAAASLRARVELRQAVAVVAAKVGLLLRRDIPAGQPGVRVLPLPSAQVTGALDGPVDAAAQTAVGNAQAAFDAITAPPPPAGPGPVQVALPPGAPPGAPPAPPRGPVWPNPWRGPDDVYRAAVQQAIEDTRGGMPYSSISLSRIQAAQKALDKLAAQGITGFTDTAGRQWNLASYVEMATRTAVSRLWDNLQAGALSRAGLDLVIVGTHSAEGTCPHCLPFLGHVLSLSGSTVGDVEIIAAGGVPHHTQVYTTLDEARAAGFRHPNCFPGDVLVSAPSGVDAAYAHWYEGDLVVIHTASGDELPVTPNHPVATPEGWIAAGKLTVGDRVLRYSGRDERVGAVGPGDEQVPSRIGDVFDALRQASPVAPVRVPAAAEQFHGDGGGSDVEVVFADRFLEHHRHAHGFEVRGDGALVRGRTGLGSLPAKGALLEIGRRAVRAAYRFVCGCRQDCAFGRGQCGHAPLHHFAGGDLASVGGEDALDVFAWNPQMLADECLSAAGVTQAQDVAGGGDSLRPEGSSVQFNAGSVEPPVEGGAADTEALGDVRDLLASGVAADHVVKIERRGFAGHVYNLQTGDGWYVASGIVVHNCRCDLIPYLNGMNLAQLDWFAVPNDEAAATYAASQVQRRLERNVRRAARERAAAVTPAARARARRDLAAARAASEAHRRQAGLRQTKVGAERREHPFNAY